jgi:hypothetical protein
MEQIDGFRLLTQLVQYGQFSRNTAKKVAVLLEFWPYSDYKIRV